MLEAEVLAIGQVVEGQIASEAGTSRAVVAGIGMPSGVVLVDTADQAPVPAVTAAPLVWDLEEEEEVSVVEAEAGVDNRFTHGRKSREHTNEIRVYKSKVLRTVCSFRCVAPWMCERFVLL